MIVILITRPPAGVPTWKSLLHILHSSTVYNGREVTIKAIQIQGEAGGRYGDGGPTERGQASADGK